MLKQKALVIDAMKEGADHSTEIAEMTGLRLHHTSSYLSELLKDGVIFKTGRYRHVKTKAKTYCYALIRP